MNEEELRVWTHKEKQAASRERKRLEQAEKDKKFKDAQWRMKWKTIEIPHQEVETLLVSAGYIPVDMEVLYWGYSPEGLRLTLCPSQSQ